MCFGYAVPKPEAASHACVSEFARVVCSQEMQISQLQREKESLMHEAELKAELYQSELNLMREMLQGYKEEREVAFQRITCLGKPRMPASLAYCKQAGQEARLDDLECSLVFLWLVCYRATEGALAERCGASTST